MVEQGSPDRPCDVGAALAPSEAWPTKSAPAPPSNRLSNVDPNVVQPTRAESGQLAAIDAEPDLAAGDHPVGDPDGDAPS
jgi:hypothetical protein